MNKTYKFIIIIILIIITILMLNNNTKDIRIRVCANSNSKIDQQIKYDIVDILKEDIKNLNDLDNINLSKIKIDKYFMDNNIKYKYKIEYKKVNFPPKEINNKLISGGYYRTLLITIGDGIGDNYWSLLYPNYFSISFEDINSGNVKVESYFYNLFK